MIFAELSRNTQNVGRMVLAAHYLEECESRTPGPDGVRDLTQENSLELQNTILRARLTRLTEASLRTNESLELETVLQGVLDSACALTEARYGVIIILDDSGQIQDFLTFGMSAEGAVRRAWRDWRYSGTSTR